MMALMRLSFPILFITIICNWKVNAFNLDARFSNVIGGQKDSYFGFSVAQHVIVGTTNESVILIGAPKDENGGQVYRCNAISPAFADCKKLETAGLKSDISDDQWLGVTVESYGVGSKAVACAHRYVLSNAAVGYCAEYTQELEFKNPFKPCEKYATTKYMQDFGLCQAGISASLGQKYSMLMGAPGSVFWKGTAFLTSVTDELGASKKELISPYQEVKHLKEGEQTSPVPPYSYLGYSVAIGRFLADGNNTLYFAAGAPKTENKGAFVLFTAAKSTLRYKPEHIYHGSVQFSGFGSSILAVDLNDDGVDDLVVGAPYYYSRNKGGAFYVYLGGKQLGKPTEVLSRAMGDAECKQLKCEHARFGISLTRLGDINMDSFQDFAVGAPYEGNGAVYIYHGQKEAPGFTTQFVQRVVASDLPSPFSDIKSFGYSLSGGVDLDNNGYPDLLVGAYESDTAALVRSRPIIRIHPRMDVRPKLVDLDGKPECTLSGVKPEFAKRLCIEVEICLNFTTRPKNSIQTVPKVVYTLEAEKNRRVPRVELNNAKDASKRVVEGLPLELDPSKETCASEIALIKGSFDDKLNPIEFTFTFHLSTDNQDPGVFPDSLQKDINTFPIIDTMGATIGGSNDVAVNVDFKKECGDDQECHSNLAFLSGLKDLEKDKDGQYELVIQQDTEMFVQFEMMNNGEAAYLTRIFIQKPPGVSYLATIREDESTVACRDVPEDETLIVCDKIGNPLHTGKGVTFEVQLNVDKGMAESFELYNLTTWVNTSSTEQTPDGDKNVLFFKVINKAEISLSTYVKPDNSILCQGEPRGASAITDEEKIGAAVQHNFIVRNQGPGDISESYITISWPYEVGGDNGKDGKYLLYLMRKPKISGPVLQCNDKEIEKIVNPLKIKEVEGSTAAPSTLVNYNEEETARFENGSATSLRRKREAPPEPRRLKSRGHVVVMSCIDKSAKCFDFKCKLGMMEPGHDPVQITMEARLWESTLLSDYRQAADVQIISWANITLPNKLKIQQDTSNDLRRAITRAVPDFKETAGQTVKWWIILVAVIVGIVVLLVVVFILYKVGFFRRKVPEEMQMYKAEKKQQPMLTDYDDHDL